ncbi:hypothetical protein D3C86_2117720 [compost metagenome]
MLNIRILPIFNPVPVDGNSRFGFQFKFKESAPFLAKIKHELGVSAFEHRHNAWVCGCDSDTL